MTRRRNCENTILYLIPVYPNIYYAQLNSTQLYMVTVFYSASLKVANGEAAMHGRALHVGLVPNPRGSISEPEGRRPRFCHACGVPG